MDQTGLPARRAAHHLLQQITGEGRLLSELLGAGALDHLPNDDRARAQRLAADGLRALDGSNKRCFAQSGRSGCSKVGQASGAGDTAMAAATTCCGVGAQGHGRDRAGTFRGCCG